jgi:hypothetical protein
MMKIAFSLNRILGGRDESAVSEKHSKLYAGMSAA